MFFIKKHEEKFDIAITCGVFDMLHAGHVNLLEKMRLEAPRLIVFLHDDLSTFFNKNKFPVQSYKHRKANLLNLVGKVIRVSKPNPASQFIKFIRKNADKEIIYLRGDDWQDAPGLDVIRSGNIPIKFISYTKGVSSTKLRDEISK